ncbi:uncharacterized protein LOC127813581 isoform X2 [Diospyros lotus]|uniref:uncharacterized protein LOC127813581 isoform X2 n=1 Tax=Diospyros lotus TaxID=55363 RepID=UPI0022517CFB|nr:uncharacterized protein LOC127813581 isoform X2 [Diospyros lotus]
MDGFALATATAAAATATAASDVRFSAPSGIIGYRRRRRMIRNVSLRSKPSQFVVSASREEPQLDSWDRMELKFGQLIGEDPKLTIAKIMSRKSNPEMSYLEVEKSFYKKKGKSVTDEIEEFPFDGSEEGKSSKSVSGLNLVRPVTKKGIKSGVENKPIQSGVKKPSQQPARKPLDNNKGSLPNVILRKPTTFNEDDIGSEKSSKLKMKPNLLLNMGKIQKKEKFSDITLLMKPELRSGALNCDEQGPSADDDTTVKDGVGENSGRTTPVFSEATTDVTLLNWPKEKDFNSEDCKGSSSFDDLEVPGSRGVNSSTEKVNPAESSYAESMVSGNASTPGDFGLEDSATETKLVDGNINFSMESALKGKPARLDQSGKGKSKLTREEIAVVNTESYGNAFELENFLVTSPIKEHEDNDWRRAEDLVKTGSREEVELISSSTRGFVVSFGSLIGFLPYRNLAARWKFLAFESWLRRKGLDPSKYKQSLGIVGNYGISESASLDSNLGAESAQQSDVEISPDMKLEDLLRIYDQEKLKFLSSFVGQKIKANVVLVDRKTRKLLFSLKPKEKMEMVEKKRSLMAKLSIGDIVKCKIKKITYFGIFVEVEGVPALIHQTEVSWDSTLDPASYFKVGQVVEAKVHQLDFSLERIFLSLKEITPDPLIEALEAVIGDRHSLDGRLQAAEGDTEWTDVEFLIKELQQYEGIQSVSKGRFFLSPGLAPTFQVYMASIFDNEYKLLARAGNKVQEVIVQTSLGKEEMKSAILTCTNRVE